MPPVSGLEFLFASLAVATGAAVQGAVGIGFALVAAPLLALIDPALVPGPILVASFGLTSITALRERHAIDAAGLGWSLVGRVPGSVCGALLLAALSPATANAAIAATLLLAVGITASGVRVACNAGSLVGAGLASGVMGTVSSAGGPPLALLYQYAPGPELRSTLGTLLLAGVVVSMASLAFVGRFGLWEITSGLSLLPGMFTGFALSRPLAVVLDGGYTRRAVLSVSAVAGASLLLREFLR